MKDDEYNKTIVEFSNKVIESYKIIYEKYPYWSSNEFVKCAINGIKLVIENLPKTVSGVGYGSAQFNNPKINFMNDVIIYLESLLQKS